VKPKTTLILAVVFLGLLALVLFVDKKGTGPAGGPEEKLVQLAAADVEKVSLKRGAETLTFKKNDKSEWTIVEPMETPADATEVSGFVDSFADLRIERVVEKDKADLKKYDIPSKEVALWLKGADKPVRILVGAENAVGQTFYAQKEGDPRVVLLPSLLKTPLEKKLYDFRRKDVFKFETKDIGTVRLAVKDVKWEARKTGSEWFLEAPLKALVRDSKLSALLDSLSNLRAKEFAAENKTPEELKKAGLDKPEAVVTLALPGSGQELVFSFHKAADKTFAMSSDSAKIVVPEADLFLELEKKAEEYRENKVAVFNSWEARKLEIRKGALALTLTKASNDKWYFDAAQKDEADASKVESFIRKVESLESTEFIDKPKTLAEFGLAAPQAEIRVFTKETGEKPVEKSCAVLVGTVYKDKKAVVKNGRFDYLFKVDGAFLDDLPKEAKDWKAPEPVKVPEKK
jgi:hypothetical protein